MSWFESIFQKVFLSCESIWIKTLESLLSRDLIWIKTLESFLGHESIWIEILETIWVMSRFESNSRKLFCVVSWFESILDSHCDSWVESESKLSETELNRIRKKLSRTHVWALCTTGFRLVVKTGGGGQHDFILADMGTTKFFYSIHLSLRKFWFRLNSWLTMTFKNWFK